MRIAFCVILVMLVCMPIAQAQIDYVQFIDFNSPGFGARARAMGGVYMALPSDGYASFENPATMIYTNKSLMSVEIFNSQDKHQITGIRSYFAGAYHPVFSYADYKANQTALSQAGAVAPFSYAGRDWWIGGGYHTIYDFYFKNSTVYEPYTVPIINTRAGALEALNLALATKPINNVSVGMNINYYVRGYEYRSYYPFSTYDTTTHHYIDSTEFYRDKSKFSGFNIDFGILAEYNIMTAGFVVRSPLTLTQNSLITNAIINSYGDEVGYLTRMTTKYKMPLTYGGGVSVKPINKLTVAADFDMKPYSKVKYDINYESYYIADTKDYNPQWKNLAQFRVGAEYIFNVGFAEMPVRAGFHNMPLVDRFWSTVTYDSVVTDSGLIIRTHYEPGKQPKTNIFSFGTGLKMEKIWFDVAYEFGSSKYNQSIDDNFYGQTWNKDAKLKYSKIYISMGMLF